MADPILQKISELDEITETDAADSLVIVDASEGDATKRTKKTRMDKIKLSRQEQVGSNVVTNAAINANAVSEAKIANGAVTLSKMAANSVGESQLVNSAVTTNKIGANAVTEAKIADKAVTLAKTVGQRVILAPKLFGSDDVVVIREFPNEFVWTSVHSGWRIVGLKASLSQASSSGTVTVVVKNTPSGGTLATVGTVSLVAGALASAQASANYTVAESGAVTFSVTGAGTNAKGLIVYLILEKV